MTGRDGRDCDVIGKIERGDLSLFESTASLTTWRDDGNRSALWWAIRCNQIAMVTELVAIGARENLFDPIPLIHLAARFADHDLLLFAISHFDLFRADDTGNTVAHICSGLGSSRPLITCLDAAWRLNANGVFENLLVNVSNKSKQTPIDIALKNDRLHIVKLLIGRYGALVRNTAFTVCLAHCQPSTIAYLTAVNLGGGYPESMFVSSELRRLRLPPSRDGLVREAIRKGLDDRLVLRRELLRCLPALFPSMPSAVIGIIVDFTYR